MNNLLRFILPFLVRADAYDSGLGRIQALQERAKNLMFRAGATAETSAPSTTEKEKRASFFRVYVLPHTTFIPAGGLAFGKAYFRLLVGNEPSPLTVTFSLDNKFPMLDGARALGKANQDRGRVFIEFDRLVLRSGKVIPIEAQALDEAGSLGLKGENENSKLLEVAGGVGLGLIAAPDENVSPFGLTEVARKSTSGRLRSSLLQESRDYLREKFKESPVLRVEEGTHLTVFFKEEVRF